LIRVLVADDEPLIRTGIRTILESVPDIKVAAEAENGLAVVSEAIKHRPDVALIDIKMPVVDGLAAIEELRRRLPALPVVVLTSFGTQPNALRAMRNGVAGFVLKNCAPDELIRAVRAAHDGEAYLSPAVTRFVLDMLTPAEAERSQAAANRLAALAPRESQVLRLVAQGMSNAEIARCLAMTETTVKTYVSRILSKLNCSNRVQAALLARDAGLSN
jgi:DNA-binding NarL/FixJ family response regulator